MRDAAPSTWISMTFIYRLGQSQGNRASRYSPHERQALSEEFSRREETGEGYGHVRVERTSDATQRGEAINMARNMTDRDPFRHLDDRRQQTQKAKILAKIAEKVFNDVVESVQKGNSESLWEVGLQAFEQANELSLIQKAGPIETLPIGEAARFDIVNGFGLQEQGEESLELQPWPPCPLPTVELPDSAHGDLANLSSVSPKGKVYQAKGTCDYTLWYGDKGGADKAINLVLVEAKKLGLASQGDDQALGYMACVHQERRTQPSRNSTVYV
ncbi:hypothetical protein N7524_008764 [Penicillium chrysogenum]|nr:hypothetical protein N7524_008764 [Penicillium chrysogenum]